MIELLRESGLLLVLLVLPLSILANNLLGAALAEVKIQDHFSKEILVRGLTKGTLVYLGVIAYSLISFLMSDLTISILDGQYTLVDAMYVVILGTIVKYATDGMKKLVEIMNYKEEKEEIKEED